MFAAYALSRGLLFFAAMASLTIVTQSDPWDDLRFWATASALFGLAVAWFDCIDVHRAKKRGDLTDWDDL